MHAIGIDLAWSPRNPSGIAVAERAGRGWHLRRAIGGVVSNEDILEEIEQAAGREPTVIAIDAPLVVPHRTRGRDGDRMITSVFGPYDAGVYPATKRTIGRYGGQRIWRLLEEIEELGFTHDSRIASGKEGRFVFETYPHAAMVALFRLPKVLKYKVRQGRSLEDRLTELHRFERYLVRLRDFDPPMKGVEEHLAPGRKDLRASAMKEYEDRLDAILCAYIAAYYWTWGTERCAIFGSLRGGYIVTPFNEELATRVPTGSPLVSYRNRP